MKSKRVRNSGGGNASAASGSRDRSSGISGNRVGGPKDSGNLRHSSNRPMSSSPSRMSGEIHNQHRGPGYQQHGGAEGHSASSGNAGVADGVYSNKRLMHACTCLIGTTVQVETVNGEIYEGIFELYSDSLVILLQQVHLVDLNNPGHIDDKNVYEKMAFEMINVVRFSAIDVDLEYAAKEGFQTDMQISSKNNGDGDRYRVLKEFEFDDFSMSDDRLEGSFSIDEHTLEEGSNGWSADDMFRMNEKKYGVQTSYKENMEGYTVQLKEHDKSSEEYRDREARAAKLAREIEGTTSSHLAAELENGDDDEENAFSAVVRDPNQRNDREGKYITPARRQHSTSSNSGGAGGKQHMNAGTRIPSNTEENLNIKRRVASLAHSASKNVATAANIPNATIIFNQSGDTEKSKPSSSSPIPTIAIAPESPENSNISTLLEPSFSFGSSNSDSMVFTESSKNMPSQEAMTQTPSILEKSTLNPGAKEFVLSPSPYVLLPSNTTSQAMTPRQVPPGFFTPLKIYTEMPTNNEQLSSRQTGPGLLECSTQPTINMQENHPTSPSKTYTPRPFTAGQVNMQQPHTPMNFNAIPFQGIPQGEGTYQVVGGPQMSPATSIQTHHQMQGQYIQYLQSHGNYAGQPMISNLSPQVSFQTQGQHMQDNSMSNQHLQVNPQGETGYGLMNASQANPSLAAMQAHQMPGHLIQYVPNHPLYSGQPNIPNMIPQPMIQVAGSHIQENIGTYQGNIPPDASFSSMHGPQGSPMAAMQPYHHLQGQLIQYVQNQAAYAVQAGMHNSSQQPLLHVQGMQLPENAFNSSAFIGQTRVDGSFSNVSGAQASPSLPLRSQSKMQSQGVSPYASPLPVKYFHRSQ